MFEKNGHIHVYSPGARLVAGTDNPLGSNNFESINLLLIW